VTGYIIQHCLTDFFFFAVVHVTVLANLSVVLAMAFESPVSLNKLICMATFPAWVGA
jgi:hypothetical protein